jgi:hypothetical protein
MQHPRIRTAPRETRYLSNLSGMLVDGRAWLVSMGDLWVGGVKIGVRTRVTTEGEVGYLVELAPPCIPSTVTGDNLSSMVAVAASMAADPRYLQRRRGAA